MATHSKDDIARARELLLRCFPKGSTVYTILRHVSRSGMQRHISVLAFTVKSAHYALGADAPPISEQEAPAIITDLHPNWAVHVLLGYAEVPRGQRYDGVKVGGCGFDAGFDIAYNLGLKLYGDGYALNHRWL